jgi:hypothetical protein
MSILTDKGIVSYTLLRDEVFRFWNEDVEDFHKYLDSVMAGFVCAVYNAVWFCLPFRFSNQNTRLYPKVSGLAAWSENYKWYSSLPLGAVISLFCQCSEFCRHKPLCCFSTSVYCCKRIFRYRRTPETFGYPLVLSAFLICTMLTTCHFSVHMYKSASPDGNISHNSA